MSDIIYYAAVAVVAMALIYGLRWLASRHASGVTAEAMEKIEAELGKTPDFVHAYGATGLGLDYGGGNLIVYDRKTGTETYSTDAIGTWFVGVISQEIVSPQMARALSNSSDDTKVTARKTETKYVVVCDANNDRICQIGIVDQKAETAMRDALHRMLPDKQNFEAIGAKSMAETLRGQR